MFQRMFSGRTLCALAVGAAGLLSTWSATAEESGKKAKPLVFRTQVINLPSASGFPAGLVAQALRAEAGKKDLSKLSPEESREMAARLERAFRLNRSSEGLKAVQAGNGMVSMNLEGRFLHIYLGRKEADGTISTACVTDWASAEAFLRGGAAGAAKPSKE